MGRLWGRLQRARNGAITAAGLATPPTKIALGASACAFGHKAVELHRAIFSEVRPYRSLETYARACRLSRDELRRRALIGAAENKALLQFVTGTPMPHCSYTALDS